MKSLHLSAISTITTLENEVDTSAITYGGVNAWPVCRLKIWVHLMAEGFKTISGSDAPIVSNSGPQFKNVGQLNAHVVGDNDVPLIHHDLKASQAAMEISTSSPELLFFVRPEEHGETVGGKAYAKILDSLFDRFAEYRRVKIEWAEPTAMGFARKNPSLFLHAELASRTSKSDPPYKLEGFDDLAETLKALSLSTVVTREMVEHEMGKILWFSRLFDTVLMRLKPKAIFLSVYYHPLGMGLTLSARRLGIPVIDVQHGRLGPHHGLYTQFTAAPENGYEIAPDRIWCWGEQTRHDIDVDLNLKCKLHSGLVGGNPWFDLWKSGLGTLPNETAAKALLRKGDGKKKILVSLQSLPHPLPRFVLEAMASAPQDWVWWIRMHPLRRQTMPEVEEQLSALNISFEIEDTTTLPLFWLLRNSDHHITSFSSVVIEALAFGLRTTVFSDAGKAAFQSYVVDGHVLFADTAEGLLEAISDALEMPEPTEEHPFIDANPNLAEQALSIILTGIN